MWGGGYSCAKLLVRFELKPPSLEPWFSGFPSCPCHLRRSRDGFELSGAAGKLCRFTVEIKADQHMSLMICSRHLVLMDVQGL